MMHNRLGRSLQERVRVRRDDTLLAVTMLLSFDIWCQNCHATPMSSSSSLAQLKSCTQRLEPGASAAALLSASFDRWEQRSQQRRAKDKGESVAKKETFLEQAACLFAGPADGGGASTAGGRRHRGLRHDAPGLHEGSAIEVEVGHRGLASQSSTAGKLGIQCPANAAIDGLTLGFDPSLTADPASAEMQRLLQAYPVSKTTEGEQPAGALSWWALDLEEAVVVTSVEAWPPRSVDQAVSTQRRKSHRWRKGRKEYGAAVTVQPRILIASLSLEAGGEAAGVAALEQELPLGHTWSALQLFQPARRLTLSPAAGAAAASGQQQGVGGGLSIAEVRVHAIVPWECQRYCIHGTCQCTGNPDQDPSECSRTFCACGPDWAGLQCDTFIRNVWDHLPLSLPSGPSPWWEASRLSSSLTGLVSELQHPRGCPAELVSYPDLRQSGLGSTLMQMSAALSDAVVQGRTFVPPKSVIFAESASECKGRPGFECYFKPWANLDVNCTGHHLKVFNNRLGMGSACRTGSPSCSRMHVTAAPYSGMGRFWWRAHLMEFLFRMSEDHRRSLDLQALKQRIGFQHPVIGVHIRHGDSCTQARSGYCRPVSDYIPAVLSAAARYNISRAFVATDNPAVVRELQARTDGIEWIFLPINRESLDVSKMNPGFPSRVGIEFRMKRGDIPVYETTTASLKDLMLLAESDVLVGTGSSSFFSVSLLLSAAWKRALPPYVSLDAAYCDRWRMCCDVMPDGSSVVC